VHHLDDPDVNRPPPKRLLDLDWSKPVTWEQIAPTGDDFEAKLEEIPEQASSELAIAMLDAGNFACPVAPPSCGAPLPDLPDPAPTATLADPCLRRLLAIWSVAQLDDADLPRVRDALRAIAALPPPESQLVAAAIQAIPETDQDGRLELIGIAWRAGQHELANQMLSSLDEAHSITALATYHVSGAINSLVPEANRAVLLGAVTDEQLPAATRGEVMVELSAADTAEADVSGTGKNRLKPDLVKALSTVTRSADCAAAAAAIRVFEEHGDHRFGPKRPRARTVGPMMRAMCVLASYEQLEDPDDPSYLPGYVAARGLELVRVHYDPYSDVDDDGDGDPHTTHTTDLIPRSQVVLPELEDLIRALHHCKDAVCVSDEREFHFGFRPGPGGELELARLDVIERPPCPSP
jgi:hypothetical protein